MIIFKYLYYISVGACVLLIINGIIEGIFWDIIEEFLRKD